MPAKLRRCWQVKVCNLLSLQVLNSPKVSDLEREIHHNRQGGHSSYYGESMELLCVLELQQQLGLASTQQCSAA